MSLDTTATNEAQKVHEGNGNSKVLNLKKGLCPHSSDCNYYSDRSYYCQKERFGSVINEKIVCYQLINNIVKNINN